MPFAVVAVLAAGLCSLLVVDEPKPNAAPIAFQTMFGAYAKARSTDPPVTGNKAKDAILQLESQVGQRLTVVRTYYHFDDVWPGELEEWQRAGGRIPFINIKSPEPTLRWRDVASGAADAILDARARDAAVWGGRVLLSFHHEPENDVDTPSMNRYGTPSEYAAAWRRVVERFRLAGADNVQFIWVLMGHTFGDPRKAESFYPGDAYVDYVGADRYNRYACEPSAEWRELAALFEPAARWAEEHKKHMIIAETGVVEDPADGNRKAAWFRNATAWLRTRPNIVGFVYFHADRSCPWWIDSSNAAVEAVRDMAAAPWMA